MAPLVCQGCFFSLQSLLHPYFLLSLNEPEPNPCSAWYIPGALHLCIYSQGLYMMHHILRHTDTPKGTHEKITVHTHVQHRCCMYLPS